MKNHIKIVGREFKAYIPTGALTTVEYDNGIASTLLIEDVGPENYSIVNGIMFYGTFKMSLTVNEQWGFIKQNCEIVETIKGSMNPGHKIKVEHTTTISEGKFDFKPINGTEREEYVMKVIPDYSALLNEFFESNPEVDIRIKNLLIKHPELLDPHDIDRGIMNTSQFRWSSLSAMLELTKDETDEDFIETFVSGHVGEDVAKKLMEYFNMK